MNWWAKGGTRPAAWWQYDSPAPRKHRNRDEPQSRQLFKIGELRGDELAEVMKWWRERYKYANGPNYLGDCTGPDGWLEGEAARRAEYKWAGIPRELVREWDAQRARRTKTIRKLARVA